MPQYVNFTDRTMAVHGGMKQYKDAYKQEIQPVVWSGHKVK